MNLLWKFFTSLRLTVFCFSVGIILVFLGTLSQVSLGLYQAQTVWFRSYFIWWEFSPHFKIPVLPGGYLLGIILLLNLIAAHIKRFVWSWKKLGIQLTHFGVIMLLIGQLITDRFSKESTMSLQKGETKQYSEDQRKNELIFATDAGNGQEKVVSVEEKALEGKEPITPDALPFTVKVKAYYPNSDVVERSAAIEAATKLTGALAMVQSEFSTPDGLVAQAVRAQEMEGRASVWREALTAIGEKPSEDLPAIAKRLAADPVQGPKLCEELKKRFQEQMLKRFSAQSGALHFAADRVSKNEPLTPESLPPPAASNGIGKEVILVPRTTMATMDDRNLPSAIIEIIGADGKSAGDWLVSVWNPTPQTFEVDGHSYRTALRFERYYHPFSITLLDATHEVYAGTEIPKNFQSRVRITDPAQHEKREVDIYMNNPLRYDGLTFYQYQMGQAEAEGRANTSTLQIVRNPGYAAPYIGCLLVALGMTVQFLMHLLGFLKKRKKAPLKPSETSSPKKPRKGSEPTAAPAL